ncbi:hypothetical protein ABEB36_013899 [Hypothenemus hampei]|uniref:Uncharacterized protein n=1 Tax=Hypothenemus hampei TaxID=57062 RepID=A0ABD1E7R5_HYPHA
MESLNNTRIKLPITFKYSDIGEKTYRADLLCENNIKFGTTAQSFKRFVTRLNLVKTRNAWENFLNTAGSCSPMKFKKKSVICVQPTSIARRRPGIVRGCKRAPIGRPAQCEPLRKRPKRRHNLAENVRANHPNAIKHGATHLT